MALDVTTGRCCRKQKTNGWVGEAERHTGSRRSRGTICNIFSAAKRNYSSHEVIPNQQDGSSLCLPTNGIKQANHTGGNQGGTSSKIICSCFFGLTRRVRPRGQESRRPYGEVLEGVQQEAQRHLGFIEQRLRLGDAGQRAAKDPGDTETPAPHALCVTRRPKHPDAGCWGAMPEPGLCWTAITPASDV